MKKCLKSISGKHKFERGYLVSTRGSKYPVIEDGHYKVLGADRYGYGGSYVFFDINSFTQKCVNCGLVDDMNLIDDKEDRKL